MLCDQAGSTAAAERLIVSGIVSGLHRHDDNSWFVPSFSSEHIVVIRCVTTLRHERMHNLMQSASHHRHDVSTRLP